jgi:hypothetical protein
MFQFCVFLHIRAYYTSSTIKYTVSDIQTHKIHSTLIKKSKYSQNMSFKVKFVYKKVVWVCSLSNFKKLNNFSCTTRDEETCQ